MNQVEAVQNKLMQLSTPLADVSETQLTSLFKLLEHDGFPVLLGLLLGERQTKYVQLSNIKLGTPEQQVAAAVLQGQIKGLDRVRETMIEMVPDTESTDESETNK